MQQKFANKFASFVRHDGSGMPLTNKNVQFVRLRHFPAPFAHKCASFVREKPVTAKPVSRMSSFPDESKLHFEFYLTNKKKEQPVWTAPK